MQICPGSFVRYFNALMLAMCLTLLLSAPAHADHVHHLWYNNSNWQDEDLTALTGVSAADGAIAAFDTTPNHQLHVYYTDNTQGHVHQLYYDGSWSDDDLTATTGGPAAIQYAMAGFAIGNFQYVFYVSNTDFHVHELSYVDNWTDSDITALAGGVVDDGGSIVAFATKPNNQFHIYYQDLDTEDVHQLYFNGNSWSDEDITSITDGAYCYSVWIAGFAVENLQHLFCPGYYSGEQSLHMLHIYYNNTTWVFEDISKKVNGGSASTTAAAAFHVPNQLEAYDVTADGHVHQYTKANNKWTDADLTASVGAPSDTSGAMVAFPTTPNNQFHIYYEPSAEVYQLYFTGTDWSVQDLTAGSGQANDFYSGMAGFAIGNLQHLFYLSTD
jgi:hypothetical protein